MSDANPDSKMVPAGSLSGQQSTEIGSQNAWLYGLVGAGLLVAIFFEVALVAGYFEHLVTLLAISLVLTYLLLFPVTLVERLIVFCSGALNRLPSFYRFTHHTPEINPRILAVLLVYFIFFMSVTVGSLRYFPVLLKEMRGFGTALSSYVDQGSSAIIDWTDKTFGANTVKRVFPTARPTKASDSAHVPADPLIMPRLASANLSKDLSSDSQSTHAQRIEITEPATEHITEKEKAEIQQSLLETTTMQGVAFFVRWINLGILHVVDLATGTVLGVVYCLAGLLLVFYFLLDGQQLTQDAVALLPGARQKTARFFLDHFHRVMDAFIRGQVLLGICTGIYVFIVYSIFGVPYALFLGVFMAICECLPVVGTWLGITPAIIVMLFTIGPVKTLIAWLCSYLYQTVKDNIIAPKIVGDAMGLHPLVVILSLLICAQVAGILGVLMALPIASALKVILQYINDRDQRRSNKKTETETNTEPETVS